MTDQPARPPQFPLARQSAGHAPLRRPGSVRRTTTIDSEWPDGLGQHWQMTGRARDLLTPADGGDASVIDKANYCLLVSPARQIMAIEATPAHPRLAEMVGVRAGGASRRALNEKLSEMRGGPLFQILDDYAGASLVAEWIWSRWSNDWLAKSNNATLRANVDKTNRMLNICTGFAEGSSSMHADGTPNLHNQSSARVGALVHPDDESGWHAMPHQQGPQTRRSRQIDLWREAGMIKVDASFQDSGSDPDGGRSAVHEYRLFADIDAATNRLVALKAVPHILPFRECPGAVVKATRMIGRDVTKFRESVIETLPSTHGCTHLNDMLRALADVPGLAHRLS
ncbi:MAG: DUF2889 domain-containing protein [Parasphingorhabdus sp.]|nr:DUF2889 domain-containing protein [Parasphingorhabdus sp.]